MDAKPQRPRALRVHDENMPPAAINGVTMPGKTLHQRTKSTPALTTLLQAGAIKAANKKVLGEVNANLKVLQPAKDDSEIGKASPGKIILQESVKSTVAAPLSRPAARPLAPKTVSAQNVPVVVAQAVSKQSTTALPVASAETEAAKRPVAKKSTKVLREVEEVHVLPALPEDGQKSTSTTSTAHPVVAPPQPALPMIVPIQPRPVAVATRPIVDATTVQRQEVHKTESVPLRDEPAARPQLRPSNTAISQLPPGFTSEQEYRSYIDYHTLQYNQQPLPVHPQPRVVRNSEGGYVVELVQPEQFYDVEGEELEYEEDYTTARSFGFPNDVSGGVTTVLAPRYTSKAKDEIQAAKEYVEATRPPEDVEDEQWDTSMVAEYGDEIFEYMRDLETRMAPNSRYMDQQQEIQWSMRAVLMDWVIQVHQRFNLLPETLFLTVNYIDRFLSCKIVSLGKLQLVGATAIFVAAKYEEVQCPTISEIIYMVDGGYTVDELLKAERFMLSMLQFELGWPGPMSFLRRISKADDYDLETRTLAKYFLEVTIMDERFVGCTPSFLAAGAHCMARLMIHNGDWSKAHVYYSNYTWSQLRQLLTVILECCEDPHKHHAAVYEKYLDKRYKRSSQYVAGRLATGFRLPVDNPPPLPPSAIDSIFR